MVRILGQNKRTFLPGQQNKKHPNIPLIVLNLLQFQCKGITGMKILKLVFSGEFFFAMFLTSGVFKETFDWIPLDLTLLLLLITGFISVKRLYENIFFDKKLLIMPVIFYLFILLLLISMLYTESPSYYIDKSVRFLTLTSWSFLCPFFLLNSRKSVKKFIYSISLISVVAAVSIMITSNTSSTVGFTGLSEGNYLGSARLIGTGAVALLSLYLFKSGLNKLVRFIVFLSLVLTTLALFMTGARMPLIAYALTFLALVVSTVRIRRGVIIFRKGSKRIFTILLLAIPFLYYVKDLTFAQTFFNRFGVLFDGGGNSALGRVDRIQSAFDMIKENPIFGKGFGSFGVNYLDRDILDYPHNIFLEVGSELGLIGFLIITTLISIGIFRSYKFIRTGDFVGIWIFASLVYLLANAMVSGSLNDNRMLFALLGIAAHSLIYSNDIKKSPEIGSNKNGKTIQKETSLI